MKTTLKTIVLAIALITGIAASATEGFAIKANEGYMLEVEFINITNNSTLILQDNSGEVLFTENIDPAPSFKRSLSLEVLPSGTYYLIMENKYSKVINTVTKTPEDVTLVENKRTTVFKPMYKVTGKMVQFALTNPKEYRTTLSVYDESGEQVGSLTKDDLVVKKTLDFSKMPIGKYTFYVQVGEESFVNTLLIK